MKKYKQTGPEWWQASSILDKLVCLDELGHNTGKRNCVRTKLVLTYMVNEFMAWFCWSIAVEIGEGWGGGGGDGED